MTLDKMWLLKAYPRAEYVPSVHETVLYQSKRKALVVTKPKDPDPETFDFDAIPDEQETRPCMCDILLGEDIINVDISTLAPL